MTALGALAALALLAAPESDKKDDLDAIQGTWTMVSFEVNGESVPENVIETGRLEIKKDVYTPKLGEQTQWFTIVLSAEKDPKTFELTARNGANSGGLFKGIYKLDGETLTMCRALTEQDPRPTEFATGAESGHSLVVWRRSKP